MDELILALLEGISMAIPSKRDRTISKKFKMLRKEIWYKKILERYSIFLQMNRTVRNFVEQTDIENILKGPEETKKFQIEFEKILINENL